jgi:hypothetical protein
VPPIEPSPDHMDALAYGHALMAYASGLAYAANLARRDGDHQSAGVYRDLERSAVRRAEVTAALEQADALYRVVQALERLDLGR